MRRRGFTIGAAFSGLLALFSPAKLRARAPAYDPPSIKLGRHRYVMSDEGWTEVANTALSWRDRVDMAVDYTSGASIRGFFTYALKRGNSPEEDRWLDIKESDYANLDLAQRQESYRDNWLRERGYTAQTLDIKLSLAFANAFGTQRPDGSVDPEAAEDKEQLLDLIRQSWEQARLHVLPRKPEA